MPSLSSLGDEKGALSQQHKLSARQGWRSAACEHCAARGASTTLAGSVLARVPSSQSRLRESELRTSGQRHFIVPVRLREAEKRGGAGCGKWQGCGAFLLSPCCCSPYQYAASALRLKVVQGGRREERSCTTRTSGGSTRTKPCGSYSCRTFTSARTAGRRGVRSGHTRVCPTAHSVRSVHSIPPVALSRCLEDERDAFEHADAPDTDVLSVDSVTFIVSSCVQGDRHDLLRKRRPSACSSESYHRLRRFGGWQDGARQPRPPRAFILKME